MKSLKGCLFLFLFYVGVPMALIAVYREFKDDPQQTNSKPSGQAPIPLFERSPAQQAGYDWASNNGLFDHDQCRGNSAEFIQGCHEYVEEAMISAGCNKEQAWERCEFD